MNVGWCATHTATTGRGEEVGFACFCDINFFDMGNSPNNAAIVEKARFLYEGREGIYIEKGALRVRVNSVRIGSACVNTTNDLIEYLAFDLEQIPTSGLPVWLDGKGPYLEPHPLRWEVGTNFETNLFHNYCSAAYGGWSLHFAQKLAAEVVEMATNFAGDDSPELYRKICGHIDAETAKKLSKTKS